MIKYSIMKRILILLACLLLIGFGRINANNSLSPRRLAVQKIIKRILESDRHHNYDRHTNPGYGNGTEGPTKVTVNMFVRGISEIDDVKMKYKVQLTLRQSWTDSRLAYNGSNVEDIEYVSIPSLNTIWIPDLFVSNELESRVHDYTRSNDYARIYPDGKVMISQRVSLTLSCPMILKLYPMDKQICSIRLASYGYTNKDIVFVWQTNDPVQVTSELHLPRFEMEQFMTDYCDSQTSSGIYSCLRVDILFKREFSFYLKFYYIPTALLVLMAGLVFWLDVKAITARLILLSVTLTLMTVHSLKYSLSMTPVSYWTAWEYWMSFCWTFIVVALVESIFVNHWALQNLTYGTTKSADIILVENGKLNKEHPVKFSVGKDDDLELETQSNALGGGGGLQNFCNVKKIWRDLEGFSQKVDFLMKTVYPLLFIIFTIYYFSNYLLVKETR